MQPKSGNVHVFSRLITAAWPAIQAGVLAVTLAGLVGSLTGLAAGYFGGWLDAAIGRVWDTLLAFPALAGEALYQKPGKQADYLPVDQAFELQPLEVRDGQLLVSWRIAKDYYLYRHRLKFSLVEPSGATLAAALLPAGEKHQDEHFGETEIYRDRLEARFPLPAGKVPVKLKVVYQGCADAGLCYPPQTRTLDSR